MVDLSFNLDLGQLTPVAIVGETCNAMVCFDHSLDGGTARLVIDNDANPKFEKPFFYVTNMHSKSIC